MTIARPPGTLSRWRPQLKTACCGDDQGLLRPDGNLTRAEMAAIMNRAFGAYKTADISQFRDVQSNKWYYEDMRKAVHIGTYEGNGNGTMTQDNRISHREVMAVVARALQLDNADYSGTDISGFPDHAAVSSWAVPYVKAMAGADYIRSNSNPQHQLTPRANITRAEFAQIFFNIIKEYVLFAGKYTGNRTGNLLVRTSNVTLKDMPVNGDLIIGCGATDGTVTLDNVTVTGRVVVWGGGTNAFFMNGGSDTERAKAFPETEVIFYNQDFSSVIDELNKLVTSSEMNISRDEHLKWTPIGWPWRTARKPSDGSAMTAQRIPTVWKLSGTITANPSLNRSRSNRARCWGLSI